MTKNKGKKGQVRVIEAILASFIIVAALSFVNIFAITPTSPTYETTEMEKLAYNVLQDLNRQGLLANFVYHEEWANLEAALRVTLPLDVYFNMTVYDLDGNIVNNIPIFYGDLETFTTSKVVVSVTCGLVGYPIKTNATHYQANYNPRTLNLQLARG